MILFLFCMFIVFQIQLLIDNDLLPFYCSVLIFLRPFNISCNIGLVVMNSFSFFLSGKLFICPLILNESFAGQSNLGCRSLLFITLNISYQSLLACKVYFEKSADRIVGAPIQATNFLSLSTFKILSLFLTFGILIMMCLGVGLFGFILFETLCVS